MNQNKAFEIITNVVNAAIQKGVFADVSTAALAAQALQTLKPVTDGTAANNNQPEQQ